MPFSYVPQPNIHHWRPVPTSFDQAADRLLVITDYGERIILAWSSDDHSTGCLVLAQEAIPGNVASYFGHSLAPVVQASGDVIQPLLSVTQRSDNRLTFELVHPAYAGSFDTTRPVEYIRTVPYGQGRYSREVLGDTKPFVKREGSPTEG